MPRLCVDQLTVARNIDRFTFTSRIIAALLSYTLLTRPVWAAPSSSLGTVVYADRAHVGAAQASVGATVFSGDRLSTEQTGSGQVRAGAARVLLSSASSATFAQEDVSPAATLTIGSATFSTANSKAFAFHVASAGIRPNTNQPTIGQVTGLNAKEMFVKSSRGSLRIAVENGGRGIPEGAAYRVGLDLNAPIPQGARVAGTKGYGGSPVKAAKNRFIWYAVAVTAGVTFFSITQSL